MNVVAGWASWEQWSNCPVTCGKGVIARVRKCQDDYKTEMAIRSVCRDKKMEKESGYCDLGPCEGSGFGNSTTVIVISTTDGSIE